MFFDHRLLLRRQQAVGFFSPFHQSAHTSRCLSQYYILHMLACFIEKKGNMYRFLQRVPLDATVLTAHNN